MFSFVPCYVVPALRAVSKYSVCCMAEWHSLLMREIGILIMSHCLAYTTLSPTRWSRKHTVALSFQLVFSIVSFTNIALSTDVVL